MYVCKYESQMGKTIYYDVRQRENKKDRNQAKVRMHVCQN